MIYGDRYSELDYSTSKILFLSCSRRRKAPIRAEDEDNLVIILISVKTMTALLSESSHIRKVPGPQRLFSLEFNQNILQKSTGCPKKGNKGSRLNFLVYYDLFNKLYYYCYYTTTTHYCCFVTFIEIYCFPDTL